MKKFWEIFFTAFIYSMFSMGVVILMFFALSFIFNWPDLPAGKSLLVYAISLSGFWMYFNKNSNQRFRKL